MLYIPLLNYSSSPLSLSTSLSYRSRVIVLIITTTLHIVLQVKSDRPLLDEPLHLGLEGGGQDPHQGLRGKPGIKSINNELLVVVGVVVVGALCSPVLGALLVVALWHVREHCVCRLRRWWRST